MRTVVCLKWVPDLDSVDVDPISGRVDGSRLLHLLDPGAEAALELALRLGDHQGGGQRVLAVTVGPRAADAGLRQALAAGADEALRIWDEGGAADGDGGETCPLATAPLLAAAIAHGGLPDVVLCGTRSDDRGTGQVPALLAELLDLPVVTDVVALRLSAGVALAERAIGRGRRELVELRLPAVVAVRPEVGRLRQASLPRWLAATRARIPATAAATLGARTLDELAPDVVARELLPPRPRARTIATPTSGEAQARIAEIMTTGASRQAGRIVEGPPGAMADAIVDLLRRRGFLG